MRPCFSRFVFPVGRLLLAGSALLSACASLDQQALRDAPRHQPAAAPPPPVNQRLRRELDSLDEVDQRYRRLVLLPPGPATRRIHDSLARAANIPVGQVPWYLSQQMLRADSSNIRRVARIIRKVGYPGRTLVGEPANEVALLVIQHSNRIPQYLPLIAKEAAKGEVPFHLYARMLDRKLMNENREQLYGTQGWGYSARNAQGRLETVRLIWPIQDAAHVNERRRQAGFDSSVEDNARRLGIEYRPMPLELALELKRRYLPPQ